MGSNPSASANNFRVLAVSSVARIRWQMLGAHLAAAHRIRRAVSKAGSHEPSLPHGAEAVLDPKSFRGTDAVGSAAEAEAVEGLRDAAVRVDRARGKLRKDAPNEALETWWAMMHGQWSMLDWLDSDQRRYVLAVPDQPNLGDPLGLTGREP
ncbi:MAG: hypothetical protein WBM46_19340 [Polyangiales bacterium]